jgi:hypothetical protein
MTRTRYSSQSARKWKGEIAKQMVKLQALKRAATEYDTEIKKLFAALPQLMAPPEQRDEKIGFWSGKSPRYGRA